MQDHASMFSGCIGHKTTVIIDCFEISIDWAPNLLARAQTFSSYKHHSTVKVLIGITPQGTVCFVSEAWGGRTSDKFLTENCGILNKLLPGDMVLADRSFTVHESVFIMPTSIFQLSRKEKTNLTLLILRRQEKLLQ